MLMTTRRTPVLGGYGAAASLRVISPVGSAPAARQSFFQRRFSTQARAQLEEINIPTLRVALPRMQIVRRRITIETEGVSQSAAVMAHSALKTVLVSKYRLHNTLDGREGGVGSIDARQLRAKSPRNAAYIQRLPAANNHDLTSTLIPYHDFLAVRDPVTVKEGAGVFRDNRAVRAVSILTERDEVLSTPLAQSSVLQKFRSEVYTRRFATAFRGWHARGAVPNSKDKPARRIYTKKSRARKLNIINKVGVRPVHAALPVKKVKGPRSVLNFRRANTRSIKLLYRPRPTILTWAIQLRRRLWNSLRRNNFVPALLKKLDTQTPARLRLTRFISRLQRVEPDDHKITRKIRAAARSIVTGREVIALKRLFLTPVRKTPLRFMLPRKQKTTTGWFTKKQTTGSNFINHAKAIRFNMRLLSKYVNLIEKVRGRSLVSLRRQELWVLLTKRWNKKFRYVKRWLRAINFAFKQKSYWTYKGEHILPDELYKLARIRLRKLDWRESDELFYRHGLKHAFTFHPRERMNTRWLEPLLLRRSLYDFNRGEYRRYQFPREQKNRKWLQKLRKLMYRNRPSRMYIKGRRWPLLRMYSQRLHRSAFHLRNAKAALKRFRKSTRRRADNTGFEKLMVGFGDRLDVNLMLLNIAPTTFWARSMAKMGLLRVNTKIVRDPSFRFRPGDYVEWVWAKIRLARLYFKSRFRRFDRTNILRDTSLHLPGNFEYWPKLRAAIYTRLPRQEDLAEAGRINECGFRWFHMDSGLGRHYD
jgi:ribosomal protein S4